MTAIEMDPQYCLALRGRGSSNGFRVRCSDYRAVAHALARADYVTWWMGGDNNKWLLVDLQGARALSGEIPRVGARVAIPFDMRYNPDVESWHAMRPLADWSKRVEVDECALCLARQSKSAFERAVAESYREAWATCDRAIGTFHVAEFRLAGGPLNASALPSVNPPRFWRSNLSSGCRAVYPGLPQPDRRS